MHAHRFVALLGLIFLTAQLPAQTEDSPTDISQITATLMDYIEGTANGQPDRLRRAFHPDFNLYTVTEEQTLRTRSGEQYIANVKEGQKANRVGRIISIDYEKDAAICQSGDPDARLAHLYGLFSTTEVRRLLENRA